MKADVVVDVGNSRIKWGRCGCDEVLEVASLPADDLRAWQNQVTEWNLDPEARWAVSGVHPARRDQMIGWLRKRGADVLLLDSYRQLPLQVRVPTPDVVGIDRLLNAVAARYGASRFDAVLIVDAGTAVTVDWVDDQGAFRGGAILPGFRLMAQVLHDHTALLPRIEMRDPNPPLPGTDTESAIRGGVYWAVAGGVRALLRRICVENGSPRHPKVCLTGGDAGLLLPVLEPDVHYWPEMTLEGIRLSAEAVS